ncbi:MAG: hypothetical protein ACP6IY_02540 [Promethearchaeia archaeon]
MPLLFIKFNIDEFAIAQWWFSTYDELGLGIYEFHRLYFFGHTYPPLFYYFPYFLYFAGGTYLTMKLTWFAFDFLSYYYIYKIGNNLFISELKRNLLNYLYLLCPYVFILTAMRGLGETITLFFILSSFYYFIREKFFYFSIFLSLGILYGLFPIFMIIPYFLYLINFKKNLLKGILTFFPVFILSFIIISLPFFITYREDYINDLLLIIFRKDYSIGFHKIFPDLDLFNISLGEFELIVSLFNIIQIIIIISSLLLFIIKYKIKSTRDLISCIVYFFILVPILVQSFHFRLLFWLIPFLIIFLLYQQNIELNPDLIRKFKQNFKVQIFGFLILNLSILIIFIILLLNNPEFGFSRISFYIILLIYCLIWGFFLIPLNLTKFLILQIFILFYCFYLYFFIFFGGNEPYSLFFFFLYCIITILVLKYIFNILK